MPDSWQLDLRLDGEERGAWADLLSAARLVVERYGVTEAAEKLNESAPYLRHALAERNRHFMKLEHLPTLIQLDDENVILHTLARQRHFVLEPMAPLDPADELAALKDVLAESLNLNLRAVVMAEARARATKVSVAKKRSR